MKAFFENHQGIIIAVAVMAVLVALVLVFKDPIFQAVSGLFTSMTTKGTNVINQSIEFSTLATQ